MKAVGINLGETRSGKNLKDGGLFILDSRGNSRTFISEERISGVKHKGGYECSLIFAKEQGLVEDVDVVFYSSCCEALRLPEELTEKFELGQNWQPIWHHDSHAALSFGSSGYESALVMVADGGGNILDVKTGLTEHWWEHPREQSSFYSADRSNGVSVISREFDEPLGLGLGEFWRNITYLLGFASSSHAAKVMELAAFSDAITTNSPYTWDGDKNTCDIKNDPNNPMGVAEQLLSVCGLSLSDLNLSHFPTRTAIAAWAQQVLERSVIFSLQKYRSLTGMTKLCLGGGTMMNCKLIQKIREAGIFDEIFVSYAPNDKGQAIGNVIHGLKLNNLDRTFHWNCYDPFMGVEHKISIPEINDLLGEEEDRHLVTAHPDYVIVYKLIQAGAIVATCFGPSEVGARALGNRSILASPEAPNIKSRLNSLKGRHDYNPVAPCCSLDFTDSHFEAPSEGVPYMSETVFPKKGAQVSSSMLHTDNTARLQTVMNSKQSFLSRMLAENSEAGLSAENFALLNTSFNRNGAPIVETPTQAVKEFTEMGLDCLVLRSHFVRKKDARLEFLYDQALDHPTEKTYIPDEFKNIKLDNHWIEYRESFSLFKNYIDWLKRGRKITTIRFMDGALSIPKSTTLPLVMTSSFSQTSANVDNESVRLHGLKIKRFKDLHQIDAQRDGFRKTAHLKSTLKTIYPSIREDSFVTINFISVV